MNRLHNLKGEIKTQLLIVTDKNGNKQGLATREECHTGHGRTHLAFLALVINFKGKVLLTKRGKNKSLWPLVWDASTVSHVLPGETVERAARRRGREELGIDVEFKVKNAFFYTEKYKNSAENEYCHILIGVSNLKPEGNPVEIDAIKFLTFPQLKKEILDKPQSYTPWLKMALEKLNI